MATLKLTILKAKKLKDGRHRIRIALCHRQETCYIITRFSIDNESQFKNGQVVKRADASVLNTKLRSLLNLYQERLDKIESKSLYNCTQLKNLILREYDNINKSLERPPTIEADSFLLKDLSLSTIFKTSSFIFIALF